MGSLGLSRSRKFRFSTIVWHFQDSRLMFTVSGKTSLLSLKSFNETLLKIYANSRFYSCYWAKVHCRVELSTISGNWRTVVIKLHEKSFVSFVPTINVKVFFINIFLFCDLSSTTWFNIIIFLFCLPYKHENLLLKCRFSWIFETMTSHDYFPGREMHWDWKP